MHLFAVFGPLSLGSKAKRVSGNLSAPDHTRELLNEFTFSDCPSNAFALICLLLYSNQSLISSYHISYVAIGTTGSVPYFFFKNELLSNSS